MDKRKVVYIGNFSFPFGNASGKRVYANGKLLRKLGHQVVFVGVSKDVMIETRIEDTKDTHDDFTYYSLSYPRSIAEWLNYNHTYKTIIELLQDSIKLVPGDIIVLYGSPTLSLFTTKMIRYCKNNGIVTISDCVDWLSTRTHRPFFDLVKWIDNTYQKAYANTRTDGVIAISSYLSEYYRNAGCKTVIVPPLSPMRYPAIDLPLDSDEKVKICYAGSAFRSGLKNVSSDSIKDRIDTALDLLLFAKRTECNFVFNIFGFTMIEFTDAFPTYRKIIDALGDSVVFHGVWSNEDVTREIMASDFTILIRDDKKETRAGFPTKVSESISCGTPVITTRTSDLEDYIEEGINGFFLNCENISASRNRLCEILSMNKKDIFKMKAFCADSDAFYYEKYVDRIRGFWTSLNLNL
jgi:glycosyltransferase involved in cell wall biosynthesis